MFMKLYKRYISALLLMLLLFYGAGAITAHAENDEREYKLKAAFLLNFSKFTTWPNDVFTEPGQTFDFCVIGEDPFGAALDGLETKKVGGRQVRLHYAKSIAEAPKCHVMFISKSEQNDLLQLQGVTVGKPIVTVSDIQGFSRQGGIFEFITRSGRLAFVVNNRRATQNRLQINASLLNLAVEVL